MNTAKTISRKTGEQISVADIKLSSLPKIENVAFIKDEIAFVLNDGRIIYIPVSWSKKLQKASKKQRQNFKNAGVHVFWDEVDEIIGVRNLLFGKALFL